MCCQIADANGEKARRILGNEAHVSVEDRIRISCEVHFQICTRFFRVSIDVVVLGLYPPSTA